MHHWPRGAGSEADWTIGGAPFLPAVCLKVDGTAQFVSITIRFSVRFATSIFVITSYNGFQSFRGP